MQRYIFRTIKRHTGTYAHKYNTLNTFECKARTALEAFTAYCNDAGVQNLSEEEVGAISIVMLPCAN